MQTNQNQTEMPVGLQMALAQNMNAMSYFAALPPQKQRQLIEKTHDIQSKQEMQSFVAALTAGAQE